MDSAEDMCKFVSIVLLSYSGRLLVSEIVYIINEDLLTPEQRTCTNCAVGITKVLVPT